MIKYSKIKESIEIPCMICGNESNIVLVKKCNIDMDSISPVE